MMTLRLSLAWCAALLAAQTAAQPAGAQAGTFEIALNGSAGARFEMSCRVTGGPDGPFELSGPVPAVRRFTGEELTCTVRQVVDGETLHITARSDRGNMTRLSTSGAGGVLRLRLE